MGQVAGRDGFAHADVYGTGPETPAVPGKHFISADRRDRHNWEFGMLSQQESSALEFLDLSVRAPGSFRENNKGNPFFEEGGGLLQAPERRLGAFPVDEDMAGEVHHPAKEGEPEEGFLGQEPYRKWSGRYDPENIQDAGVIGDQNIGLALSQILYSFQLQMNTVGPEKAVGPETLDEGKPSAGPIQKAAGQGGWTQDGRVKDAGKNEE